MHLSQTIFYSDTLSRFQLSAFILQHFSILRQRRFTSSYRNCGLGESERAGPIGGAGAYLDPFHSASGIDNISNRHRNDAGPVALVFGANDADQLDLGEKTNRIGSERNVRTIHLAIARDPVDELRPSAAGPTLTRDMNFILEVSFRFKRAG